MVECMLNLEEASQNVTPHEHEVGNNVDFSSITNVAEPGTFMLFKCTFK